MNVKTLEHIIDRINYSRILRVGVCYVVDLIDDEPCHCICYRCKYKKDNEIECLLKGMK